MTWKKTVFSYLIWLLYGTVICFALLCLGTALCGSLRIDIRLGILFAFLTVVLSGALAWGLRRFGSKPAQALCGSRSGRLAAETAAAVGFFAAGLALRLSAFDTAGETAAYFTAAKVTGQEIPQIAHGAVYFYVCLLRGTFLLLGNHFAVGVALQIILQYIAAAGAFFVLRRLLGSVCGLTVLGFMMCSPYMVRCGLNLSPEMLYFCLFIAAASLVCAGARGRLRPPLLLLGGAACAFLTYLDAAGILFAVPALGMVFCLRSEHTSTRGRARACLLACLFWLLGFAASFCGCVLLDSLASEKSFEGVWNAWVQMYWPKNFYMPMTVGGFDSWAESLILLGLMAMGLFSFWFVEREERLTPLVLAAGAVLSGSCFGVFTEEMPGTFPLFFLFSVMAGVGLGQCFSDRVPAPAAVEESAESFVGEEFFPGEASGDGDSFGGEESGEGSEGEISAEEICVEGETVTEEERPQTQYLENPLPLPKKHVKKVLDYDYTVDDNDDFDY